MNDEELEDFFTPDESEQVFELEDRCSDGYRIILRFRNQKDYFEFVDLIQQPKLKVYSKALIRETTYPSADSSEDSLDHFF